MKGNRKVVVIESVLVALIAGLGATLWGHGETTLFAAYAGACVGAGGWFFKANTDEHKAQGGEP